MIDVKPNYYQCSTCIMYQLVASNILRFAAGVWRLHFISRDLAYLRPDTNSNVDVKGRTREVVDMG
jgi:hypothetical protein